MRSINTAVPTGSVTVGNGHVALFKTPGGGHRRPFQPSATASQARSSAAGVPFSISPLSFEPTAAPGGWSLMGQGRRIGIGASNDVTGRGSLTEGDSKGREGLPHSTSSSGPGGRQNLLRRLIRREVEDCRPSIRWSLGDAMFARMVLQVEYDTHDPMEAGRWRLEFLRRRSRILEIVSAQGVVFALSHSGICCAFSRGTNSRLCYLNTKPDEVIRSLFYNKYNESLITVSVHASDNYSSLQCRSTRLVDIRRRRPQEGTPVLVSECLKWPGFVEFDDANGRAMTYNAQTRVYKIFDLDGYELRYSICEPGIQEVKISLGMLLLMFARREDHQPLRILSIHDGSVVQDFAVRIHGRRKVELLEHFDEKVFVKQELENLSIIDIATSQRVEVLRTELMPQASFVFLGERRMFITFQHKAVSVWTFAGDLLTTLEDHQWYPNSRTNNMYFTQGLDIMICYCNSPQRCRDNGHGQDDGEGSLDLPATGAINVSNIRSGECLVRVSSGYFLRETEEAPQAPLRDVTAIFYDEERHEIYTGNRKGTIHAWGVGFGPP